MLKNKRLNSLFSRFSTTVLVTTSFLIITACAGDNDGIALPDDPTQEAPAPIVPDLQLESPQDKSISDTASTSEEDKNAILKNYDYVDPNHLVPYKSLESALLYFHQNKSRFQNTDYISVINFAQSSKEKRFYIINLKSGSVWSIHVAHGKGSDPDHDGYADKFSNTSGSNSTSLGFYRTAETYYGSHGLSLRLEGLSSTNSKARSRAIVIHGANYVKEANVIQGRSWGCPAVTMEYRDAVIKYLKNGSLIYATVDRSGTKRPLEPSVPSIPSQPSQPSTPSTPPDQEIYTMSPLAWETSSQPQRKKWSQYLMKLILEDWNSLLKGADDINHFCPKYYTLSTNDRANVWAQLIVGMTKFESGFNPTSRMHETTMGTDPVTKKPVYSEGLLQLSYQDVLWSKFCKFDWSKDKNLNPTDPKKTILDPYINLHCGVGIMAKQIARTGKIKVASGAYWAVLKTNSRYQQINAITSIVKSMPICK